MAVTRVTTINELKQIFVEVLLNKTNKVSKVSSQSVLNGVAFGVAKIAQKALKDIAIVESHLFPNTAYGVILNTVAQNYGVAARFGPSESSTFLRLVGDPGVVYTPGTHVFSGGGVEFDLEKEITIGDEGYTYAKVRSKVTGVRANVESGAINSISPVPTGHKYVVNEYRAEFGRDAENDQLLRVRIKNGANLAARGTIEYLTQTFNKINPNILGVRYQGISDVGVPVLVVLTQNGIDLNQSEIDDIKGRSEEFLNLSDINPLTGKSNVEIKNAQYEAIDISFRCDLDSSFNVDTVRQDLQIEISKYLDFRFWIPGSKVEWDDLLQIVKSHVAIKYVPDTQFFPGSDIVTDPLKYPRLRGFLMLNLGGEIIINNSGTINPIYYPATPDFSFQATILSSI